jgi:AcrR family transcriptional regulator
MMSVILEDSMNKNDLRYKRTHALIRETFLKEMSIRGFTGLTVKRLIDIAHVNRSTFYAHFDDIRALLDEIEDELVEQLAAINREVPIREAIAKTIPVEVILYPYFLNVAAFMHDNGATIQSLTREPTSQFLNKAYERLRSQWSDAEIPTQLRIPQNYAITAMVGLLMSLSREWVRNGFEPSKEEFATILTRIASHIPEGVFSRADEKE